MRTCPKCNSQLKDDAPFCTVCGAKLAPAAPAAPAGAPAQNRPVGAPPMNSQPPMGAPMGYAPPVPADPNDHTHEYNPRDISDHKAFVLLMWLNPIGLIIALLMHTDSPYLSFHIRQYIKYMTALMFFYIIAFITIIGWIALPIIGIVGFVLWIIGIVYACQGKAKELPIVRSLGFLK